MSLDSPSVARINSFVFGDAEDDVLAENAEDITSELNLRPGRRESMYVKLFQDALCTVLEHESHLFSPREIVCFKRYDELSYNARYLLIRLCLRKNGQWHRLSNLKYKQELGGGVPEAIRELCQGSKKTSHYREIKAEIIDLTIDEFSSQAIPGPSQLPLPPPVYNEPDLTTFADDHSQAELNDLLECLTLEELRDIAKQMKSDPKGPRNRIVDNLLRITSTQATLCFPRLPTTPAKSGNKKKDHKIQSKLPFASIFNPKKRETQLDRLRDVVMDVLQQCVRLNPEVVQLFQRVNLVYFRSTQYSPTLLTPSILAQARKRTYAAYTAERTLDIWPTREALLEYEKALELEAQVDAAFEGLVSNRGRSRSVASKTPALVPRSRPATESPGKRCPATRENENDDLEYALPEVKEDSPRVQAAKSVKVIFESVLSKWQDLVAVKDDIEDERRSSLRRFEYGHILTRIICKGSYALGILKQFEDELRVLEALLGQRKWRRGRRGRWHERRALILMTHMGKSDIVYERARQAVVEGLEDDDTHIIYRTSLERRLTRLEKKLKLPEHERHVCEAKLEAASEEIIYGTRVYHTAQSLKLDKNLRPVHFPSAPASTRPKALKSPDLQTNKVLLEPKNGGKSIWYGRSGEEVTVEALALQHYEDQGFKGYHSEGRIVTTLFGLLFWDIIFASIPGAFETSYQAAPLDIAEDTFFISRKSLINERLEEIRKGKAPEIIEHSDDQHRKTRTMCSGVRWELFSKRDLLEIAKCVAGDGLAAIGQLLCEDYASRTAGVPDLIVWNAENMTCKFVEVKGPGDSLSENQKVWIDVLVRAGVAVDVCRVVEQGMDSKNSKLTSKSKPISKPIRKRKRTPTPMLTPGPDSAEEMREVESLVKSEEKDDPLSAGQASTHTEVGTMLIDVENSYILPDTGLDSIRVRGSTTPTSRKRVEVLVPSPRSFKRIRQTSPALS